MKRILTAAVAIPILLFTIWSSIPYFFVALAAIAVFIALNEFYNLASRIGYNAHNILGYVAGFGVLACFVFDRLEMVVAVLTGLIILSFAMQLAKPDEMKTALASVSATVMGVVYVALLAGFLVGVRMVEDTSHTTKLAAKLLTTFFAMVIFTDTGAFYAGRALGRHKLALRISPGKTIEGFIGGLLAAIGVGALCKYTFFPELNLIHGLILGGLIGLIGPVGDLSESLLKRGSEVKDSGTIMPGHGGMLDRVDSVLFCAPLVYFYWRLFMAYL
ncbi:MAG: phosphatidate cytidylyltransferase [Acidobacteriota bacterium]